LGDRRGGSPNRVNHRNDKRRGPVVPDETQAISWTRGKKGKKKWAKKKVQQLSGYEKTRKTKKEGWLGKWGGGLRGIRGKGTDKTKKLKRTRSKRLGKKIQECPPLRAAGGVLVKGLNRKIGWTQKAHPRDRSNCTKGLAPK